MSCLRTVQILTCLASIITLPVAGDEPVDPTILFVKGMKAGPEIRLPVWTNDYPWKCVGKVKTASGSFGTGTLVGDDIVLTNAHVIEKKSGEIDAPIVFFPGYADGPREYESMVAEVVRGESETGRDYAILRLTSPLGKKLGHPGVASRDLLTVTKKSWKNKLFMIGYSSDLYQGEVASHYVGASILGDAGAAGWLHDCDSMPGSSGSGLMYLSDDGSVYLVALHWGGIPPTYDDEVCVPVSAFWNRYLKFKQGAPFEYTTVHFLNNSKSDTISVSLAYPEYEGGKTVWITEGYWNVKQGRGKEIQIRGRARYSGSIYYHARGGGREWGGDTRLAAKDGTYKIRFADSQANREKYGTRGFKKASVSHGEMNVFRLKE